MQRRDVVTPPAGGALAGLSERIAAIGPLVDGGSSVAETGAFLQAERTRWTASVQEIGVLPE